MNPHMKALFESLQEALLIVSATGETLYANPVAQEILQISAGANYSTEWLQSQIRAIRQGYLKLPLTFQVELPRRSEHADQMQVTLLQSPAGSNFILVMKNITAEQLYQNAVGNLAEMVHSEFGAPVKQFLAAVADTLAQFENSAKGNLALQNAVAVVSREGASLERVLQKASLLAGAYRWFPMRDDQRVLVTSLVDDALLASQPLLVERGIQVRFCGLDDNLPVIYGSKVFLTQALAAYLAYLVERIGRGVNILISAKASGNVVLLTITNYGDLLPEKSSSVRLPFSGMAGSKSIDTLDLPLALCKRVVELNGGTLRFGGKNGKVRSITFELPVGAPAKPFGESCDECPIASQAMQYARDLAELLANSKDGPPLKRAVPLRKAS